MKYILSIYCIAIFQFGHAQHQKGIAFQAIARNDQGIVLSNKQLQVRISILTDTLSENIVYQEVVALKTNPLGMLNILIGGKEQGKIISIGAFARIQWAQSSHFLRIEIDPENKLQFTRIGQQQIQYAAYSFTTDHLLAANMEGVITVQQGGTGVTNLTALKTNLQLDKVANIPDSLKLLSKASLQALHLKLDKKDTISLSNRIQQKLNKGEITHQDIVGGLGFLPFEMAHGAFFDTSRQIALANTATAVKWKDTISNHHVYISNNTNLEPSRITVFQAGVYAVQWTVQVSNAVLANDEISLWIRRNGAAFPNTLRQFQTGPIGSKNGFSHQSIIPIDKGDYIELFCSVRSNQTQFIKTNSLTTPARPSIPAAQIQLFRIQ
jgi:hypothetical protein